MLIIDGHLDLAWNALQWNRDLRQSVYTIRTLERDIPKKGYARGTVALPELRAGRVALCFATVMARSTGTPAPHIDYPSATQAYAIAQGHLAYYRALEAQGHVRIVTDLDSLNDHIAAWEAWERDNTDEGDDAPPLGIVVSMESADPILAPAEMGTWWDAGLRIIGPTHYGPGRYAGGTGTELGLTELGPALLAKMERYGIALDLTHLSDQAFWEALDHYDGLVLASHNNCRTLVPHQRQFDDAQLQAIIARDGVIGAAFDNWMLEPGYTVGESGNEGVTIATVVDHIDHVCQLAGSSRHAAIGTDLDGGYGTEQSPNDLDTIADLQMLVGLLSDRGYSDEDITNILHGNWLRLLRQAWSD